MESSLFEFSPYIIAIVPVIVAMVSMFKSIGIPAKYAPLVAIIIGITLIGLTDVSTKAMLVQGLIAGLSASGLFSGGKSIIK